MDNRKNTILLTVIAVATLLVAVVGATFAYFTAQGGTSQTGNINVQTEAAASSSFEITGSLAILANMDNFAQVGGSTQARTISGVAKFTAGTGDGAQTEFCYTATLAWNAATPSDFVHTDDPDTEALKDMTLTVTKNTEWDGDSYGSSETIWDDVEITTSAERQNYLQIPVSVAEKTNYTHKMTATAGQSVQEQIVVEVSFNWSNTVDQTANAGKTLTGTLTFNQTACA